MEMLPIIPAACLNDLDQLHIWRSKFFDKAAKCERELRRLLESPAADKTHFKTMAEKILSANKEGKKTVVVKLVEELIPLIELRAELAHSHFVGFAYAASGQAMFDNAGFSHAHFEKITMLSVEQRKKAYDRLSSIAGQLVKINAI